jgi:hypothetical protein
MSPLSDFPLAHLAIVVNSLAEGVALYTALGFSLGEPEVIASQHVRAQVASKGELRVELLEAPMLHLLETRSIEELKSLAHQLLPDLAPGTPPPEWIDV